MIKVDFTSTVACKPKYYIFHSLFIFDGLMQTVLAEKYSDDTSWYAWKAPSFNSTLMNMKWIW